MQFNLELKKCRIINYNLAAAYPCVLFLVNGDRPMRN